MILIGFVLTVALFIGGIFLAQGNLSSFFDLPSLALSLLPALLLMFFSGKWEAFKDGLSLALRPSESLSGSTRREAMVCYDMLVKVTLASGITATLLGVTLIFQSDKSAEFFFNGMGVAMLSTLYSVIFAFFFYYPILRAIDQGKD